MPFNRRNFNFPRSFGSCHVVLATHSMGSNEGATEPIGIKLHNPSTCYYKESSTSTNNQGYLIAIGFT